MAENGYRGDNYVHILPGEPIRRNCASNPFHRESLASARWLTFSNPASRTLGRAAVNLLQCLPVGSPNCDCVAAS